MRISILVLTLLLIVSCASTTQLITIEYNFLDNIRERRIDLSYKNGTSHRLCLSPEDWPNSGHKLNQAGNEVFLVIGDKRFPIENFNTGYCPHCVIRVNPGQQINASIPYGDFSLPESLYHEVKQLEFRPAAYRC